MEADTDTKDKIISYLKNEFGLDDSDISEMLVEFCNNTEILINKAAEQLAQGSFDLLSRTGHSIKGASANVGANVISGFGKNLEFGAKENNKEECAKALKGLNAEFENLRKS